MILRGACPHMSHDPHPAGRAWCPGGPTFRVVEDAAVRLIVDRLGTDLTTAAVLVRDLVPTLLAKGTR